MRNVIILASIFILSLTLSVWSSNLPLRVIRVVDGDTVVLSNGEKVRILGIDAYDKSNKRMIEKQMARTLKTREEVISLGKEATKFGENTLIGRTVSVVYGNPSTDKYGRSLGFIFVNGINYSVLILKANLANVYCGDKGIPNFKMYEKLSEFKCLRSTFE